MINIFILFLKTRTLWLSYPEVNICTLSKTFPHLSFSLYCINFMHFYFFTEFSWFHFPTMILKKPTIGLLFPLLILATCPLFSFQNTPDLCTCSEHSPTPFHVVWFLSLLNTSLLTRLFVKIGWVVNFMTPKNVKRHEIYRENEKRWNKYVNYSIKL